MKKYEVNQANSNGRTYFAVFGKQFNSRDEATKYAEATVKRREQLAGKELDFKTLMRGVEHRDDMDAKARAAAANWQPILVQPTAEPRNPFDDVPDASFGDRDHEMARNARKKIFANARKEWDAKRPPEDDPKRAAAIEWAEAHLERVQFDPSQPQSVVTAAEQMLRQAKEGDLNHFKQMSEAATALLDAQQDEQVKATQAEYDRALQRLQALKPEAAFEGSAFVKPGEKVDRMHAPDKPDEIVVLRPAEYGHRIMHRWPADRAPADVVALAPAVRTL